MGEGPELCRARQPDRVLALVVAVLAFQKDKRRIADPEVDPVAVARLRVAGARTGRLSIENRREDRELRRRIDLDPDGRRRQRIGRPALRQVEGRQTRPAEGGVHEIRGVAARQELDVDADLARAHGDPVAEFLLVPKLVEPRRRQPGDIVDRQEIADVFLRQVAPVDLEHVGVQRAAGEPEDFLSVDIELDVEAPGEGGAPPDAAGNVTVGVAEVERAQMHALRREPIAGVGDARQGRNAVEDRGTDGVIVTDRAGGVGLPRLRLRLCRRAIRLVVGPRGRRRRQADREANGEANGKPKTDHAALTHRQQT